MHIQVLLFYMVVDARSLSCFCFCLFLHIVFTMTIQMLQTTPRKMALAVMRLRIYASVALDVACHMDPLNGLAVCMRRSRRSGRHCAKCGGGLSAAA